MINEDSHCIPQFLVSSIPVRTISEKIHINSQINQTLEQIAQAIFKSWFVDFDPVKAKMAVLESGGTQEEAERAAMGAISGKDEAALEAFKKENPEGYAELAATAVLFPAGMVESESGFTSTGLSTRIPEGWEVKALGRYLEVKRGGSPRPIKDFIVQEGYPWVKIADATSDKSPFLFSTREYIREEGLKKTVYLEKGSLILSNSATPGLPKFLQLNACIHDGWLYFPKKEHFTDTYLYFLFHNLRNTIVAQGNGSVFTNLKTDILKNQPVVVPNQDIIGIFTNAVQTILQAMQGRCEESYSLATIRDTLLPKLLSGEIELSSFGDREVVE